MAKHKGQFIWNTYGDWIATLVDGFVWDHRGTCVAWVEGENKEVFTADGEWIGQISKDSRILRKRTELRRDLHPSPPAFPPRPDLPARAPLPPTFSELPYSIIDVLEEDPDVFKHISDRRPDME
nr:hypothetical protein [Anaerolineae bacterium]